MENESIGVEIETEKVRVKITMHLNSTCEYEWNDIKYDVATFTLSHARRDFMNT